METLSTTAPGTLGKNLLQMARELGDTINQHIDEEEDNRRLSRPVFNALKEAGFFKLFLPKSLGGFELDPLTTAKVVEEVARHNTAAGWSVMVANTSVWWSSSLPETGINEVFNDGPNTFIAGAFHPPMKATHVADGFLITGRSPLTSNVHEAQWIYVTAFVMEHGQIKMNHGQPEIIGVYLKAKEVQIIDTWFTLGMRATDSNDIAVNDFFVPSHLTYPLLPDVQPNTHYRGQLYQFPAMGASIACLIAPVALAVARNAIEELKALAAKKTPLASTVSIRERGVVQRKLGKAEAFVQSSRAFLYQKIAEVWDKTLASENIPIEEKAGLLLAAAHANQSCAKAVDMMYSAAGSTAIYTRNKLEHYFTDAQVIRQHGFANESRYETVAQVYLGLPPDLPVLVF